IMVGERVHVFLNDELVVNNLPLENFWERGKPLNPLGMIELQAHKTVVHFRNIYLREIPRSGSDYKRTDLIAVSPRVPVNH
ncbi:MAG: family 16 glycoside hydrolase, partial [Limisphaerales bacterium]